MSINELYETELENESSTSEKEKLESFFALKAELVQANAEAEAGRFKHFDAKAFEPDAFEKRLLSFK
jgi:hypothetical protein